MDSFIGPLQRWDPTDEELEVLSEAGVGDSPISVSGDVPERRRVRTRLARIDGELVAIKVYPTAGANWRYPWIFPDRRFAASGRVSEATPEARIRVAEDWWE